MSEQAERKVAKKGFGTVMIDRLREVDHASTEELAKLAEVTVKQAYTRLMFLQTQEGLVVSVGKGSAKVWSMADKAPPPAPVVEGAKEETISAAFNRSHGWKPSMKGMTPLEGEANVEVGDKLLVEYPEGWRDSAFVSVSRLPDTNGVSMCWDVRSNGFTYVPVSSAAQAKYGVKIARVEGEKAAIALENE